MYYISGSIYPCIVFYWSIHPFICSSLHMWIFISVNSCPPISSGQLDTSHVSSDVPEWRFREDFPVRQSSRRCSLILNDWMIKIYELYSSQVVIHQYWPFLANYWQFVPTINHGWPIQSPLVIHVHHSINHGKVSVNVPTLAIYWPLSPNIKHLTNHYPLVIYHSYGQSPCLMATKHGSFP